MKSLSNVVFLCGLTVAMTAATVGITFFGPPYSEPTMIKLAYAYEQATHHRVPPKTTPPLAPKPSNE